MSRKRGCKRSLDMQKQPPYTFSRSKQCLVKETHGVVGAPAPKANFQIPAYFISTCYFEATQGGGCTMKPIVIVGAVAAGMSAASVIKRELPDTEVVVFGRENYISYGACGIPYYISGQLR